jgi:PD-(D/E)XK nuclease superfamily
MEFGELSRQVIGCAIEVHRNLGPGLLESTYRQWPTTKFTKDTKIKEIPLVYGFFVLFVSFVVTNDYCCKQTPEHGI